MPSVKDQDPAPDRGSARRPKRTKPRGSNRLGEADRPTGSQTDIALDRIRSSIIDLALEPGSRIDENLLLNAFQLGRTPAREATSRLVAEGFVNIVPNRGGTFVRKLDMAEIDEILVAHQVFETILGQLCRLDDEAMAPDLEAIQTIYREKVRERRYLDITALNERFHMRMSRTLGNSFIHEYAQTTHRHLRRLLMHLYRLEASEPATQDDAFVSNLAEHDAIIAAVAGKDRAALVALLPAHARATQDRLIGILRRSTVEPFALDLGATAG